MEISNDTTALVTGANGGIGMAIARALHQQGAKVIITGRRADALKPLADELGARVIIADLSKRDDVTRCVDEAGQIDVLVANAALPSSGPLSEYSHEQIDRALEVNLRAPIVMAKHFAPQMQLRKSGQIVFISSISSKVASPGTTMYSATKFGLRGFALALREDLHGSGVGVTSIYPGFIRDAGMFADTGVVLPAAAGTRTSQDVARAVLRAVRRDTAEITVAGFDQSFGAFMAGFSHGLVATLQRMVGGDAISKRIAAAQAHKR